MQLLVSFQSGRSRVVHCFKCMIFNSILFVISFESFTKFMFVLVLLIKICNLRVLYFTGHFSIGYYYVVSESRDWHAGP